MNKKQILIALAVAALLLGVFFIAKHVSRSDERTDKCKSKVLTQNSVLGQKGETVTTCP